jgi:hypothetical protein
VTKRGDRFASSQADWSKFSYIKRMHDVIYNEFDDTGISQILEEKVSMDRYPSLARHVISKLLTLNISCLPMKQDATHLRRRMVTKQAPSI